MSLAISLVASDAAFTRVHRQPAAVRQSALVIDHRAVAEFDRLSDDEIEAAARLRFLLRSASIGWNIDQGLRCLMNDFAGRSRRPNFCRRGIPPGQDVFHPRYDHRNWTIEVRGNPGWYGKISDFAGRIDGLTPAESFGVVGFNFNYSDGLSGSTIVEQFFSTDPGARSGNVATIEALETRHTGQVFVWWSMALPRRSSTTMLEFNRRMRAYAIARNKVLFDLADIESHSPEGAPCTDNEGGGLEAICADYTDERNAGHLNARGSQRAAKALWVMMARLARPTGR
jgi:hypothetical protein